MTRRCVCPGSYDPVTLGHADVIERAAALYDEVVVAVLHNPTKAGLFSPEERRTLLEEGAGSITNVRKIVAKAHREGLLPADDEDEG